MGVGGWAGGWEGGCMLVSRRMGGSEELGG